MPSRSSLPAALLCGVGCLLACRGERAGAARPLLTPWALDVGSHTGLSDLTVDGDGHFWSVPERQRALLRLDLDGASPGIDAPEVPILGVPDGHDTESLAYLGPGRFALGLESPDDARASDAVVFVELTGGVARVTDTLPLPYALWGLQAENNEGIEGLCAAAGLLLAGVETVGTAADGGRFAPLARLALGQRAWTAFSLPLSSRFGKLSALACRALPGTPDLQAWAIERHIGVSRLLTFRVPRDGPGGVLQPQVLLDFADVLDAVPNLEGLAVADDGDIVVLSDNDFGLVTGPTQAARIGGI